MIDQENDILLGAHEELKETSPELAKQLFQMWEVKVKESMLNKPDGFEYVEVLASALEKGMEIINLGIVDTIALEGLQLKIHLHSAVTNVNELVVNRMSSLKVRV